MTSSIDALLTEHLTYPPVTLVDDIVNGINTISFKCISGVESALGSASPSTLGIKIPSTLPQVLPETTKHEIENGVHQLQTLLDSKIDKNFDILEIYIMRNLLTVEPGLQDWVRLKHYEGVDFSSATQEDDGPTAESVKQQRLKLREMMKLQTLLLQERKENEATLQSIQSLLGQVPLETIKTKTEPDTELQSSSIEDKDAFSFLQDKGTLKSDKQGQNLTTSTEFTLSSLPSLKNILEDLQPRLEALQASRDKEEGDAKSEWRKERSAFVEKETRRHLEGVRGLELGEQGSVRDGEWQGSGRRVGMEEVEALERVVGLFGAGKGKEKETDVDRMDES